MPKAATLGHEMRDKRDDLIARERKLRQEIQHCERCNTLRGQASKLANEAASLLGAIHEEIEIERGLVGVRRFRYDAPRENAVQSHPEVSAPLKRKPKSRKVAHSNPKERSLAPDKQPRRSRIKRSNPLRKLARRRTSR